MKCVCCKREPQNIFVIKENAQRRGCSSEDYVKWELSNYVPALDMFVCPDCINANPQIQAYDATKVTANSQKVAKFTYLQQFDSTLEELKVELGMYPPDIASLVMPKLNSRGISYFLLPASSEEGVIHLAVLKQHENEARKIVNETVRALINS